jgi:hypothetical protein
MEQVFRTGFQPLAEQQQKAKTGSVRIATVDEVTSLGAATSAENLPAFVEVAKADPLRTTVGGVVVDAAKAVDDAKVIFAQITNDLAGRRVVVSDKAIGDAPFTAANAVSGTDFAGNLSFDNGSLNNDSVTNAVADGTGLSAGINAKLATRKPSYSLAALINAVEDVILADGTKDALVVIDQENETIKVLTGTEAAIASAFEAAAAATDKIEGEFIIDSTPQSSSTGSLLGE